MSKQRRIDKEEYYKSDSVYTLLESVCKNAKDLANKCYFIIRQHIFNIEGKQFAEDIALDYENYYIDYYKMYELMMQHQFDCFRKLPANTSQEVLKQVDREWKSYFALKELFKKGELDQEPNFPKYRPVDGTYFTVYNATEFKEQKTFKENGIFYLPKMKELVLKSRHISDLKQVRIVPHKNRITVEYVYEKEVPELLKDNQRYLAIDIGVDNLAACASNVIPAFIISGKNIKSANRLFNKELARLQTEYTKHNLKSKSTNKMSTISDDRNFFIEDEFHKASRIIVDICVKYNINTIVIGKNKNWKSNVKMKDKDSKQNFIYIPFNKLISKISYKAVDYGIQVVEQEESYTSKASFFDNDYIPTYGVDDEKFNPSGKRTTRGVYRTKDKMIFNADINGALNILRKYLSNLYKRDVPSSEIISEDNIHLIEKPKRITLNKVKNKKKNNKNSCSENHR